MYKIAVLGSSDTVVGFKALGIDAFPADDSGGAREILRGLTRDETYAIIYVEEDFAVSLRDEIAKYSDAPTPAIILIPGKNGSLGLGRNALKEAAERAIGSDIL